MKKNQNVNANVKNFLDNLNPTVEDIIAMSESDDTTVDFSEEISAELRKEEGENRAESDSCEEKAEDEWDDSEETSDAVNSIQQYLNEIGKIPKLTPEEEKELGKIIREGVPGSREVMDARNKLVQANLCLVFHFAKKYIGRGLDIMDINTLGVIGLIKAAEKFDYSLGFKFSTYASWWVKQGISRGIADEADSIRVPVHMKETMIRVKRVKNELFQMNGVVPSARDIADYTGLPLEKVLDVFDYSYNYVSMSTPVGEEQDSTMEEFIEDADAEDPCDFAINEGLKEALEEILSEMGGREADILRQRFGIGSSRAKTLEEIARENNVTRERIRQLESRALNTIRRTPRFRRKLEDYVA